MPELLAELGVVVSALRAGVEGVHEGRPAELERAADLVAMRYEGRQSLLYTPLYMPAIRTQIYLTAEQRRRLDARRKREGRTLAALVREAVDTYLANDTSSMEEALDRTFGSMPELAVPSRKEWEGRDRRIRSRGG